MARLIVIEGLDGLGKTTIAKELAKKRGFKYIKADTSQFKKLTDSQKEQMHPMRRFLYYLSAYADISEHLRLSTDNEICVTDRYTPSLQVYTGRLAERDLSGIISEFDLISPDTLVLLVGDEESRSDRVENRDQVKSDWDVRIQEDVSVREDLRAKYFHVCRGFPIVLNTGRSMDETIDEIESYVDHELVDLHTHTSVVDGILSPSQVIRKARSIGLKAIAITDHDTLEGIPEARKEAESQDIEFISGIEVTAKEYNYSIHILGYFIDETNNTLMDRVQEQRRIRRKSLEEKFQGLKGLGFDVSLAEVILQSPQRFIGKKNIAYNILKNPKNRELVKRYIGDVADLAGAVDLFKKKIFEDENAPLKRCYTPTITITDAIGAIHESGGLAFVAHPHKILNNETMCSDLEFLKGVGIDGIETTTTFMAPKQIADLLILANKTGLLCSGGSNYHCDWNKEYSKVGRIEIGTGVDNSLCVPYHFVRRMEERLR